MVPSSVAIMSLPFPQFIPMPVLYGVFLYMGASSLKGIQVGMFIFHSPHQVTHANTPYLHSPCSTLAVNVLKIAFSLIYLNHTSRLINLFPDPVLFLCLRFSSSTVWSCLVCQQNISRISSTFDMFLWGKFTFSPSHSSPVSSCCGSSRRPPRLSYSPWWYFPKQYACACGRDFRANLLRITLNNTSYFEVRCSISVHSASDREQCERYYEFRLHKAWRSFSSLRKWVTLRGDKADHRSFCLWIHKYF